MILTFKICTNNKPTDLRMDKSKHYSEFNAMVTSRRGFIHINNIPKKKKRKKKESRGIEWNKDLKVYKHYTAKYVAHLHYIKIEVQNNIKEISQQNKWTRNMV